MQKMRNTSKSLLTLGLLAFLLAPAPCQAAVAEDSEQEPVQAAEKKKSKSVVDSEVEAGLHYLDEDSFRYGKYSGLTEEGAYLLFNFRWEQRPEWNSGDAIRWRLQGWRLGLDSRRLEFDWSQQGKQRFIFDYRQVPNNLFNDGMTPYLGLGSSELTLPGGWEVGDDVGTTWTMLKLDDYLRPFEMKTERKSLTLSYDLRITSHWNMELNFKHDVKDGLRHTWGMFGYSLGGSRSAGIPAPVDWTTDNLSAMFHFANGRLQFGAGLYASFFANDETSLTWQNAYGRVGQWEPGVEFPNGYGRMALEPDNSFLQLKAYGGFVFSSKTRLTADISWGEMEQNDALLPYTVNPDLRVRRELPRSNADATIEMLHFSARFTTRLAKRLNLVANYIYDDRDNKTPQAAFYYIGADSQDQPRSESAARINLPFSYTRQKTDLVLNWNAARGVGIKGGVEWKDYSRDYTEVEDSDELAWLAGIRFASLQTLSASLDYRYSERDVDEYVGNRPYQHSRIAGAIPEDEWQNHPWQRKYNQTDREREEFRLRLDWFPAPEFNFGVTGRNWEDDYGEGYFGLTDAEARSWSLDLAYHPRDRVVLSAYYTHESWQAGQSNRQIFSFDPGSAWKESRNWAADTQDDVDTYNLHLGFKELGESQRFNFGLDYTYSNVESRVTVTGAEFISTAPLPPLTSELKTFVVYGSMDFGERCSLMLRAESGKFSADDFGLDHVEPDTMFSVLSLGQSTQEYDIMLLSASWTLHF
jgi:MtrB/PioB family decaheme-associated outer membrane protein